MKLAIVGSRRITDSKVLVAALNHYKLYPHLIDLVISGGAPGTDTLAEELATYYNIPFKEFPAEWDKYGKAAGPIRNKQIVEAADAVLALWVEGSKGTANTIKLTKKANKPLFIYPPEEEDTPLFQ